MTELVSRSLSAALTETLAIVVPVGTVIAYVGHAAPDGWALCYGQAISRTTYSNLFTVIGEHYGVGDGSTTFNVPDLRGHAPVGDNDMGGVDATTTHINRILHDHGSYSEAVPITLGTEIGDKITFSFLIKTENGLPDAATSYPVAPAV